MATFLLAWNPKRWVWKDLKSMADRVKQGEEVADTWSFAGFTKVKRGDRVFLIRLVEEPKGMMASGIVTDRAKEGPHWEPARAKKGDTYHYVEFIYDRLQVPGRDLIIARDDLRTRPFDKMHWDTQSSGISIPGDVASALEKEWGELFD